MRPVHNTDMKLDDPDLLTAMRGYLRAVDAVAAATTDEELMRLSEEKVLAGLLLRKRLVQQDIPTGQRTTT